MTNTSLGLTTKALILFPLVFAVYFFDIPVWNSYLRVPAVQVAFLMGVSVFALGVFVKRRALYISLETSETAFAPGVILLAGSALLFFYGSYTSRAVWFHSESLLLFIVGYLALRVGMSFLRILAPLLLILALSFIPFPILSVSESGLIILLTSLVVGGAYLLFVGAKPKQMALAVLIIYVGLGAWVGSVVRPFPYLTYLIPLPLLLLALPRVRSFVEAPSSALTFPCYSHKLLPSGFCSFCGRKVSRATTSENVGPWGLLTVCAVVVILILSSVPMLTIGDGPHDVVYSARGPALTALPITPQGWLLNTTKISSWDASTGTYESVRVYVLTVHPEVKNYTVYYSVSPDVNVPQAPSGIISGWRWISSTLTPMAGFQGRLTTYTHGNTTMLSYGGSRQMTFLKGSEFLNFEVTIGYVREFKNPNLAADTTQFLTDLQTVWIPSLTTDSFYSSWTSFVGGTLVSLVEFLPVVEVVVSISLIGWVAYRAMSSEERLDRFYAAAMLAKEKGWLVLVELLRTPKNAKSGYELSGQYHELSEDEIDSTLRALASQGLVKPKMMTMGNDIRLVWKAKA
ncbi:MAG TPA: hypothetical protein VGR53_09825 [Nitrososphaerales archaeon]|nr:hypothetical protein [Nitrososphaerales archaeon]